MPFKQTLSITTNIETWKKSNIKFDMKKFIFYFFIYIGLSVAVFNNAAAKQLSIPLPFEEVYNKEIDHNNLPVLEIKADNEFFKLYAIFLLADKIFADQKINDKDSVANFLHLIWPKTDIEKLRKIAPYLQFMVMSKRRYVYVVDRLKQKIKAATILPEDAPVIAGDGEYAPKYSDERKSTPHGQYKVSFTPYRFLEYDNGELGEPVRRRDKNYQETKESVIDEITLALLQFDIGKFVQSLKKLPPANDGSREVSVELGDGLRSRIILATSEPGSKETIKGVIEVAVPKGWYINGDYLNPKAKPKFYLSEDKKEDLNIKEYQLFYPEAIGVVNDGITSRILVDDVKFPITFTRRDVEKDLNIKGQFVFEICRAKTKDCRHVVSNNSLFLERSIDEEDSIHYNFVTTEFGRLPPQSARHAELKKAIYNPATKMLNLKFKTTKKFNNAAAMAEDAAETNFTDAQYRIKSDEIDINFKTDIIEKNIETSSETSDTDIKNIEQGGDIAVTAAFDEFEVMRVVVKPEIINIPNLKHFPTTPNYLFAFFYGLILSLMPGIAYLLQRLLYAIYKSDQRQKIFLRYAASTLAGIALFGCYMKETPWWQIYENKYLILTVLMLITSYLMASWNYMDFDLFRPLKSFIRRGYFMGIFTVLISVMIPTLYKTEVLDNLMGLDIKESIYTGLCVWSGLLLLPLLGLLCYRHIEEIPIKMQYLNRAYTLCCLVMLLRIGYVMYDIKMLVMLVLVSVLTAFIWYIYPVAITETISHRRSQNEKYLLFTKVQHHAAIIIASVWILSNIIILFMPLKKGQIPSVAEVIEEAQTEIASDKSLLFILKADWLINTVFDRYILKKIDSEEILIKTYSSQINHEKTEEWLKTYGKNSPPLNILFTKRHPKGFVLPDNIDGIDWDEAVSDFIPTLKKQKGNNQQ